jgi:hypothetical protein
MATKPKTETPAGRDNPGAPATYRRRRRERSLGVHSALAGASAPEDWEAPAASEKRPCGYRLQEEIVEATPDVLLAAHLLRGELSSVVTLRACRLHEARAILEAYRAIFDDEPANYWAKVLLSNLRTARVLEEEARALADAEAPRPGVSSPKQVLDETIRDLEDTPIAVPAYVTEDIVEWCLRRLAPDGGRSDTGDLAESRIRAVLVDPDALARAIVQAAERDARRADDASEAARLLEQARQLAGSVRSNAGR